MRVVCALGGNALLRRGERPDAVVQEEHVAEAVAALAPLAGAHELVITHGNGPQIGMLALESASDASLGVPYPLDVLGAQTQGMIGYWIQRHLAGAVPGLDVVVLLTRTEVDPADPAFHRPTKFIGPGYGEAEGQRLAADRGWTLGRDGERLRRVVPSPAPRRVLEASLAGRLVSATTAVVCAGGGGIPVVAGPDGGLRGVEAVVDKDAASALLAKAVGAELLLLLTDVRAVEWGWRTPRARPIGETTPAELASLDLPAGSMGPKVAAACGFVEATGATAAIGALADAAALVAGHAGTIVRPARHVPSGAYAPLGGTSRRSSVAPSGTPSK